jgi:hypothetical protein
MAILNILCPFGTFCIHLVHFFSGLGNIYQEKSGNPGCRHSKLALILGVGGVSAAWHWRSL